MMQCISAQTWPQLAKDYCQTCGLSFYIIWYHCSCCYALHQENHIKLMWSSLTKLWNIDTMSTQKANSSHLNHSSTLCKLSFKSGPIINTWWNETTNFPWLAWVINAKRRADTRLLHLWDKELTWHEGGQIIVVKWSFISHLLKTVAEQEQLIIYN